MLDVGWKLMLWMLFFVDDFCWRFIVIYSEFIKNVGAIICTFLIIIQRNEILKMQDVTDKKKIAGILTQVGGVS